MSSGTGHRQADLFGAAPSSPDTWYFRTSRRARRLSIQIHGDGRVEVVVPAGVSPRTVAQFVAKHRSWVESQVKKYPPLPPVVRPDTIWLGAIERQIEVQVLWDEGPPRYKAEQKCVKLSGPASSHIDLLRNWLKSAAQWHLAPRMLRHTERVKLNPKRVSFRLQKTRWGSYSQSGTLSLNAAILLLPERLADYVMLHELCHIQHLDHSPRFWSLLETHCPGARSLDRELDAAQGLVPRWVYASPAA